MSHRPLRFLVVFASGLGLVWALGIGPGGSFLGGGHKTRARTEADRADLGREAPDPGSGVSMHDIEIPVREEEEPGEPPVLKYVVVVGELVGQIGRRMPARDVHITVFNKKLPPDERQLARVQGEEAIITFDGVPDPRSGFRDTKIREMTLTTDVRVDYLADDGSVATTLTCQHLDLSDVRFRVPGKAIIEQEGLTFSGEGLTYDKETGIFRFEHDVVARVTRFSLPGSDDEEQRGDEESAGPPPEKTIRCAGPFTFVPAEKPDDSTASEDTDLAEAVGGGVLTFENGVVATQGDTILDRCERLVMHVDKAGQDSGADGPPGEDAADAGRSELEITHVEAYGPLGEPARLRDPRATLLADVMLLEPASGGQAVVLRGSPRILDAAPNPSDDASTTRLSAGADREIRIEPDATAAGESADSTPPPEGPKTLLVSLLDGAWLRSESDDVARRFELGGDRLELILAQIEPDAALDAAPAESRGDTDATMALERLLAEGDARGSFSKGSFRGQRIEGRPRAGAAGETTDAFELRVSPDPTVDLVLSAPDAEVPRRAVVTTRDGELRYVPPMRREDPLQAIFTGRTEVSLFESDQIATSLEARDSLIVELAQDGEQRGLRSMVADGAVAFRSPRDGVSGGADRLRLLPAGTDQYKVVLDGSPAVCSRATEAGSDQVIRSRHIEYDPSSGHLRAVDRVDGVSTTMPGLAQDGSPGGPDHAPGKLSCRVLDVFQHRLADGEEELVVDAREAVAFDDPVRGVAATGAGMEYRRSTGRIRLEGDGAQPARVRRQRAQHGTPDVDSEPEVSIVAPLILLDQTDESLVAPTDGRVELVTTDARTGSRSRVVASSRGPIEYRGDRLLLRDEVLVRFRQDGEERRALWCDMATVVFRSESEQDAPERGSSGPATSGFDHLLAEGRVHLEQTEPRPLIGEGETLEWRVEGGRQVMILRGVHPKAWVDGLLTNRRLRYVADRFRLYEDTGEFEVENGEFSFVEDGR